jgi:hypothetical protein
MISQEKLQESTHFNSLDHIQKQMILKKDNREKISLGLIMSELRSFDFWLEKCQPSDRVKTIVQELIYNELTENNSNDIFTCNDCKKGKKRSDIKKVWKHIPFAEEEVKKYYCGCNGWN